MTCDSKEYAEVRAPGDRFGRKSTCRAVRGRALGSDGSPLGGRVTAEERKGT